MKEKQSAGHTLSGHTLTLTHSLTKESVPPLFARYKREKGLSELAEVDMNGIEELDTSGIAFIEWLRERAGKEVELRYEKSPEHIRTFLEQFLTEKSEENVSIPPPKAGILERTGEKILNAFSEAGKFTVLTAEIFFWSAVGIVRSAQRRKQSVFEQCWIIGVQSLPLVALLSVILGVILSLQSALQLENFGANIYVANLMSISMVNEMGPMMTAILVAGRSGSAFASEIATMKVSEEIEALEVMGIDPIRYVIVPKFLAITLTIPILVIFSIYIGIGGGVLVGATSLDITPTIFISRSANAIGLSNIIKSLSKSILFGWIIVTIGSYFGFSVSGGAEEVGKATTLAVVYSIITIIILDGLFSLTIFL